MRVNKLKLSFSLCVKGYGVMRGYRISFVYVVFLLGMAFAPRTRGQFPSAQQFVQEEENLLPRAMALHFDQLHRQGNTIIVVTHEESIARSAHRVLSILDGEIASDERASGESAGMN